MHKTVYSESLSQVNLNSNLETSLLFENMQGGLLYILFMLSNRSVKLLTIYIASCIPLHNIFVKKEKYHKVQFCGVITIFFFTIIFRLQEYYITMLEQSSKAYQSRKYNILVTSFHCPTGQLLQV